MDFQKLEGKLKGFHQEHLLKHLEDLDENNRKSLYEDLESIPYDEMNHIFKPLRIQARAGEMLVVQRLHQNYCFGNHATL